MKIAIQKKGRLNELSIKWLKSQNIVFKACNDRKLILTDIGNKNTVFLLRDDDIPNIVDKGIADWGIVGSDVYNEYIGASKKNNLVIMKKFENEVCKFMIAGKQNKIQIKDLNNKNIATSYPNMLKSFLTKNKIKATIKIMNGSIEAAIDMQYADFICDLVSSGETLKNNGLRPLITVTDIYPVLIKNKKSKELICK